MTRVPTTSGLACEKLSAKRSSSGITRIRLISRDILFPQLKIILGRRNEYFWKTYPRLLLESTARSRLRGDCHQEWQEYGDNIHLI
jgi:hypothetical protein